MTAMLDTVAADEMSAIEAAKAAIVPALVAYGIASIAIAYDGYGDEGQIESITAFDAAGAERPLPEAACPRHETRFCGGIAEAEGTLAQALDAFGYEVLAAFFGGWENNEGSLGTVIIDATTGAITVAHDWRVTALERDERTL